MKNFAFIRNPDDDQNEILPLKDLSVVKIRDEVIIQTFNNLIGYFRL